ncbi:MAG: outer membrane beta-barrel protein [Bacteroidales bacterium]|nr:outer membrane beta-barrel protein [Bacteroidales bacterium]
MKKFLILFVFLIVGYSASAQLKVNAGYLNSKISAKSSGISTSMNGNGVYAGLLYELALGQSGLVFEPGVNVDYVKFKVLGESESLLYLRAPLHLNYKFDVSSAASFFIGAGPSVVVGVWGEDEPFGDGGMKPIELQIGALLGVRLVEHFEIRAGYDWGVLKAFDSDVKSHRNSLTVGLAYTF